jgi:hypothetical protein
VIPSPATQALDAVDLRAYGGDLLQQQVADLPSNPAAGSAQGSAIERQDYFKKCVANGGQPPGDDQQKSAK